MNFLMFVASVHGLLTEEFEERTWPSSQFSSVGRSNQKHQEQWKKLWNQSIYNKGLLKRSNQKYLVLDPPDFLMIKEKDLKYIQD